MSVIRVIPFIFWTRFVRTCSSIEFKLRYRPVWQRCTSSRGVNQRRIQNNLKNVQINRSTKARNDKYVYVDFQTFATKSCQYASTSFDMSVLSVCVCVCVYIYIYIYIYIYYNPLNEVSWHLICEALTNLCRNLFQIWLYSDKTNTRHFTRILTHVPADIPKVAR